MVDGLTMYARPASSPPQVQLELLWTGHATATVERLDPDGRWRPVRTGEPATLTSGLWSGFDVEVPYGAKVSYRATDGASTLVGYTTAIAPSGGAFVPGDFTDEFDLFGSTGGAPPLTTVSLAVPVPWLVHPGVPDLSQPLTVKEVGARTSTIRRGVFRPIGRSTPVAVSQIRDAPTYEMRVQAVTLASRAALRDLLADGSTLLLNLSVALGWDIPTGYVSVGDIVEAELAGYATDPFHNFTLPLTVVDRPIGGQAAQWSWDGLQDDEATWGDVEGDYASWTAVLYHQPHG